MGTGRPPLVSRTARRLALALPDSERCPREVQCVALAARSPEKRRDGAAAAARALDQDDRGHCADLGPGLENFGGPGVGPRQRQP